MEERNNSDLETRGKDMKDNSDNRFPNKKYKIIYADPPWSISTTAQIPSGRPNTRPYRAMRQIEIYDLPVNEISDKDSLLFLWATSPLIPEALYTLKCWGFEFKCVAFTWIKKTVQNKLFWGMGWWTRSNPEFCILGTKGDPKRVAKNILSVIESPIQEHSKKPSEVYDKIVQLCGDLPRIELFARTKIHGWDSWGNDERLQLEPLESYSTID